MDRPSFHVLITGWSNIFASRSRTNMFTLCCRATQRISASIHMHTSLMPPLWPFAKLWFLVSRSVLLLSHLRAQTLCLNPARSIWGTPEGRTEGEQPELQVATGIGRKAWACGLLCMHIKQNGDSAFSDHLKQQNRRTKQTWVKFCFFSLQRKQCNWWETNSRACISEAARFPTQSGVSKHNIRRTRRADKCSWWGVEWFQRLQSLILSVYMSHPQWCLSFICRCVRCAPFTHTVVATVLLSQMKWVKITNLQA